MYNDEIKEILKRTYEICAHTLDYGSALERSRKLYFYTLDDDCKAEIVSVRDALNRQLSGNAVGRLTELHQLLPRAKWDLPQCVCYEENNGEWEVTFRPIQGIRYHRTFGKRVAASLILRDRPLITLSENKKDTFYGYWDETFYNRRKNRGAEQITTDGMNYRVNRNLMSNEPFRRFTVDLFSTVAAAENRHILKDIGRTIAKSGCFLPSMPYGDVMKLRTPQEMIRALFPESGTFNINFNRVDMNAGYVIAALSPVISKRDLPVLVSAASDLVGKCVSIKNLFDGFKSIESIEAFLVNYYRYERRFSEGQIRSHIQDYVHMCLGLNEPIKLRSSFKKLAEAHDTIAQAMRKKKYLEAEGTESLIPAPSRFDRLEKAFDALYPGAFQRIHTSGQLLDEGEFQHNCVCSREDLIREDRAAVFHWDYDNASHTIQFAADRTGKYYVDEIKARFNAECSFPAITKLKEIMAEVNKTDRAGGGGELA